MMVIAPRMSPLAIIVGAAPHPEDVLRETHMVRKLDIGQAHADVRGVVHEPLAVDHPLGRVSHVRDTTGPDALTPLPDHERLMAACAASRFPVIANCPP